MKTKQANNCIQVYKHEFLSKLRLLGSSAVIAKKVWEFQIQHTVDCMSEGKSGKVKFDMINNGTQ